MKTFRLDSMMALANLAGNPQLCAPVIHIAGSKGKGSLAGMIASVLEADGLRAARYLSPHICDFRERVCLGNSFFDESVYCGAGDELRDIAEHKVPASKISILDPENGGEAPTFFELLTMFFFLCARRGNCDVMVVETGMGGRLDSTNIVDPLLSVITFIELEHTAYLGNTIAAVAGEKAGIIKPGRPLVLGRQKTDALRVFQKRAAECKSPLLYMPDIISVENARVRPGGTDFLVQTAGKNIELSIPIPGLVQAENAALAVLAINTAFPGIGETAIRQGLANVSLPARFEKISRIESARELVLIIDGAHTPESTALCAETFCLLYGEGGVLLFGCAADKDAAGMAKVLVPRFSQIFITMPGSFKSSDPEKVYRAFCAQAQGNAKMVYTKDTREAIRSALDAAQQHSLPLLSTGSFYLASEFRKYNI